MSGQPTIEITPGLLRLGAAWAVLTVAFELAIGWLRGLDATALLAALNPVAPGSSISHFDASHFTP